LSEEIKPVPEYYIHFTLARFENGRYNTLEFDFNKKITDFKEELALPPGNYMLVTGNRLNDSRILSSISFFDLSENEHKTVEVKLRKEIFESQILGKIDLKNVIGLINDESVSLDKIRDKGLVIICIEPDKEPTKHVFNDLPILKSELDSWGGYFLFLTASIRDAGGFDPDKLKGMPENSIFRTDNQLELLLKSSELFSSTTISLPFILLTDKNGNILFISSGYRIGIGEQILKHLK